MSLLANVAIDANKITVIVLCIAVVIFLVIDAFLVLSLNKRNNKLAGKKELPVPEQKEDIQDNEDIENIR